MHPTGAEIGCVQTRTTGAFIKDHQIFAFFKPPKRRGQRANVHRLRRDIQQMRAGCAPISEFERRESTTRGAAPASPGQLFNSQTPGVFLVHRGHIIKPVEIRQVLQVRPSFPSAFPCPGAAGRYADRNARQFRRPAQAPERRTPWAAGCCGPKLMLKLRISLFAGTQGVFKTFGAVHHLRSSSVSLRPTHHSNPMVPKGITQATDQYLLIPKNGKIFTIGDDREGRNRINHQMPPIISRPCSHDRQVRSCHRREEYIPPLPTAP